MQVSDSVKDHLVELVISLFIFLAGVALSIIGADRMITSIGAGLMTFGGILFSWVASKSSALDKARAKFNSDLGTLSRALGQATILLTRTVEQAVDRQMHSATAFALVSQGARMISGQVNEIAVLRGEEFSAEYLVDTAKALEALAQKLEGKDGSSSEVSDVRKRIENLKSQLTSRASGQIMRSNVVESISCPHCDVLNDVSIGDFPGDTSSANSCTSCDGLFNAHRRADGKVFTRLLNRLPDRRTPPEQTRYAFNCPTCKHSMNIPWTNEDKTIICLDCNSGLRVNPDEERVVFVSEYDRVSVLPSGAKNSRPLVSCPKCDVKTLGVLSDERAFYCFCENDELIFEVTREKFNQWKSEVEKSACPEERPAT